MPTNKFHYIWMGRLPTGKHEDSFKNGPNALAQQLRNYKREAKGSQAKDAPNPQDQEIIMWLPQRLIQGIREAKLLDPDITLKPVEDLYTEAQHLTEKEKENLKTTVDLLGEQNAFVAQKDIFSAAILEEHGGYFLDTTTEIDSIEQLINKQPQDVWFPRMREAASNSYDEGVVILPDIWALYNPTPGEGTFKGMLNSYVQRCQYYFPEKFKGFQLDPKKTLDADGNLKSGYRIFGKENAGKGSEIMKTAEARDLLIGQTAIYSFLDGVKQTKGPLTDERMHALSSLAEPDETDNFKKVKDFGIVKFHKGLWRNQALTRFQEEAKEPASKTEKLLSKKQSYLFEVSASDFKGIKLKYHGLKGNDLKDQILKDFEGQVSTIEDKETLSRYVEDFKKSIDYKVLTARQGFFSNLFRVDADSKKKVDEIVKTKMASIEDRPSKGPDKPV